MILNPIIAGDHKFNFLEVTVSADTTEININIAKKPTFFAFVLSNRNGTYTDYILASRVVLNDVVAVNTSYRQTNDGYFASLRNSSSGASSYSDGVLHLIRMANTRFVAGTYLLIYF